jgi:hypothetical protein
MFEALHRHYWRLHRFLGISFSPNKSSDADQALRSRCAIDHATYREIKREEMSRDPDGHRNLFSSITTGNVACVLRIEQIDADRGIINGKVTQAGSDARARARARNHRRESRSPREKPIRAESAFLFSNTPLLDATRLVFRRKIRKVLLAFLG